MQEIIVEKDTKIIKGIERKFDETELSFICNNVIYSKLLFDRFQSIEVSDKIVPFKYCYTPEQGFYENPNWVEPDTSNTFGIPDDVYMAIKKQAIQEVQNELNK